ncbi:MAG TPA: tRNA lysidine(34) synthetase TilS [Candidatus Acidoferrales bacterium]|nr:tRNA lysidine(34) synthetase TilS [Candidatus Acidoferrales bacterium]
MRTALEQQILATVRRERLAAPGDRIGVAVSGGADSVALLRLLHSLRRELGIALSVIHFDHMLRGAESCADADFVAALAASADVEFILAREDVAAAALRNSWNLEEAGRRLRYTFFEQIVASGRASRIAVAHTADDQAETVLAHMVRGTGPAGLAAIYPTAGAVVRPLLWTRREELRAYLREIGQDWRDDASNQDTSRLRARVRRDLLPVMERGFSHRITEHLGELARLSREEQAFWTALIESRFRELVRPGRSGFQISTADLMAPLRLQQNAASAPPAASAERPVTERLIRRLYEQVKGDRRGLTARHVEQVIHLATHPGGGHMIELPGGVAVRRDFDALLFFQAASRKRESGWHPSGDQRPIRYEYPLTLPSRGEAAVTVPELGSCFLLKVIDWRSPERETEDDGEALDADRIGNSLILRSWRPGDAYRPRRSGSRRKLKELFQAGRVRVPDRAGWPVIESLGRVVWARGLPAAEEFFAREGTRTGVLIEERRVIEP